MEAVILTDVSKLTFDRVDRVKEAVGERPHRGDDRIWILGQRLEVATDVIGNIRVPQGFVTDGASIPGFATLLTGWRRWDPPQRWAGIVHDWLYCCNGGGATSGMRCGKDHADDALAAVLSAVDAELHQRAAMYWAVRLFGRGAYNMDQRTGPTIRV